MIPAFRAFGSVEGRIIKHVSIDYCVLGCIIVEVETSPSVQVYLWRLYIGDALGPMPNSASKQNGQSRLTMD